MTDKLKNRYNYLKKLINAKNDTKILIDGQFWYNQKAYNYVNKINKDYFLNPYYNLTNLDYLLMVDENKSLEDLQNKLYYQYETQYATSIWSAFVECWENMR